MLTRTSLLSALAALGLWSTAAPVMGQALLPYVLPLDYEGLEEQGLALAQEAFQLAQIQQFELALAQAQLASQLAPDEAIVWSVLGTLSLQMEDLESAIAALNRAQALEADNPAVLFALGTAHFRNGDYRQASTSLESGLALEPDNPGARFDLGNAYFKLQQFEDAIAQYEQSVEIEPAFWPSINNIGLVQYEQGDVNAAIASWEAALEAAESEQSEPQLAIAVARFTQDGGIDALDLGIIALERDSNYADLAFLDENLWGPKLLADTQTFFEQPQVRAILVQL